MTLGEWLDARDPQPPAALAEAVRIELADDIAADISEAPGALLRAGERVLSRVLKAEPQTPAIAPDLLLADALVTYAFEAVAKSAAGVDEFARDAMSRLGGLSPS